MILDFIKILLEEPSKLKKLIILMTRMILAIILASWLYTKIVSTYTVFDLLSFQHWTDFIVTGRIIVVALMYLISYFLLYYLLEIVLSALIIWLMKPKPVEYIDKSSRRVIGWMLQKLDFLDINENTKKIRLMEKSDSLYEIAGAFTRKETKDEIISFQHSLINEIFYTYVAFLILYFSILSNLVHTKALIILLLVCFALFLFTYAGIGIFMELMYRISPDLLKLVDLARTEKCLVDSFRQRGFFLYEPDDVNHKYKLFDFKGKTIAVLLFAERKKVKKQMIEECLKFSIDEGKFVYVFTNRPIDTDAQKLIQVSTSKLLVVSFNNTEELNSKIKMMP